MATYDKNKATKLGALEQLAERIENDFALKIEIPDDVADIGNSLEYQTRTQVDQAINAKVSSTYRPGGSVTSSTLPTPSAENAGLVYNVSDAFTADDRFIEGEVGKKYPAGTNIVVVEKDGGYKFDALAGFVDLSGLATKVSGATNGNFAALDANGNPTDSGKKASDFVEAVPGMGLSTNDYDAAAKAKLNGIAEGATKFEVSANNGYAKINGVETKIVNLPEGIDNIEFATDEEVKAMLDEVFGSK